MNLPRLILCLVGGDFAAWCRTDTSSQQPLSGKKFNSQLVPEKNDGKQAGDNLSELGGAVIIIEEAILFMTAI